MNKKIVFGMAAIIVIIIVVYLYKFYPTILGNKQESVVDENIDITVYKGNTVKLDLDMDGREDSAYIVGKQTGGSGTFYYVEGILNTENGEVKIPQVLLGDRIEPVAIDVDQNILSVIYLTRNESDAMATAPSIEKTSKFSFDKTTKQFVVKN